MGRQAQYSCEVKLQTDIQQIIQQNFHSPKFNVSVLAQLLDINLSSLRRLCHKLLKQSPSKILQAFRMNQARQLLLEGKLSSEVAHVVRFAEHKSFSTAFKKATGVRPRDYLRVSEKL